MKKLFFLLAVLATLSVRANEVGDTTFVVKNKKIVVNVDSIETHVQVFDTLGNELSKTRETTFVDGQEIEKVYVSSPFVPTKKKKGFLSHHPDFYIGTNLLGGGSAMHNRDSRSLEWGMTPFTIDVALNEQANLGFSACVQIGFVHNHFNVGYVMDNVDGVTTMVQNPVENVRTSFLKYTYYKVPLILEWNYSSGKFCPYVGAGLSLELRGGDKTKYRVRHDKTTVTEDVNMRPLGANLEFYAGVSGFTIYLHYALTGLFKNGPECHPLGVGIGFTL